MKTLVRVGSFRIEYELLVEKSFGVSAFSMSANASKCTLILGNLSSKTPQAIYNVHISEDYYYIIDVRELLPRHWGSIS